MVTLGVVVASFLIVPGSSAAQILVGVGAIPLCGMLVGLFQRRPGTRV